jgi:hypothetical protein
MSATYDSADSARPIDARAAATISLLAVALVAVLGMRVTVPAATQARPSTATIAPAERVPATSVKIIGASPRSETCDGQVWPYIEGRCLTRAPAAAARSAETTAAAPPPAPAPRAATTGAPALPAPSRAETSGAALPVHAPVAADDRARSRSAASHLQLPPRRTVASSTTDAWMDDDLAQPYYGTQSRRDGRRTYRNERNWRRRHAFPFFFR